MLMKFTVKFFVMVVCAVSLLGLSVPGWAFTVVFPPPDSYVEHEAVNLVLRLDSDAIDTIRVKVNDFQYPDRPVRAGAKNACFGITLAAGLNRINVDGYAGKKLVSGDEFDIFFRSHLDGKSARKYHRYSHYIFHAGDNETSCKKCHNLEPNLGDLNPDKPEDSPCYSCHKDKITAVNQHMPTKKWQCLRCHELKKDGQKYGVPKPVEKLCYRCHGKKVSGWKKMKMVHGPTAVGQCTLCHDPHGSDFPSLVRMQITDLCTNCHMEKESGQHVIAGFFGKGHPTRGVPDPFVPGKEFTCAGCHSPHASKYANLLRQDGSNMGPYCNGCHKK